MNDQTLASLAGLTPAEAAQLEAEAKLKRAEAETSLSPIASAKLLAEADGLEDLASRLRCPGPRTSLDLRVGRGSEVSLLPHERMPVPMRDIAEAVQTPPDMLAAQASLDRLALAREAGVLNLAVGVAESVGAKGAIEQIQAHEIAAGHSMFMRLMAAADTELSIHRNSRSLEGGHAIAGATRSVVAAARLLDSVTRAASALDRLRHGGRQHVTVQHITVADGGQAVVAGKLESEGRGQRRQDRSEEAPS